MKSVLRAVLYIMPLILISTAVAKTTEQGPPPPSPPPPVADYSPKTWKEYQSESGKFSIKLPGQPKESAMAADGLTFNTWLYGESSFITYGISWWDYPALPNDAKGIKEMLDLLRTTALVTIPLSNPNVLKEPKVLKEEDAKVEQYPGRLLLIELDDKTFVRMKWVIVNNRIYAISVQTRKDPPNAMMSENGYEQIAMSYLNSFRLIK